MKYRAKLNLKLVKILTLSCVGLLSGCSFIQSRYADSCKSRAYVNLDLQAYLSRRYDSQAPVRMAIIPYSAPANVTALNNEYPGMSNELAWKVHAELLAKQIAPIVEVFNRQDWPGKKEEFFTGNYGALALGREAGYDLIVVGYVQPARSLESVTAYTKIIEVESGVTVWYGEASAQTGRDNVDYNLDFWDIDIRHPTNTPPTNDLVDNLARCIADGVVEPPI